MANYDEIVENTGDTNRRPSPTDIVSSLASQTTANTVPAEKHHAHIYIHYDQILGMAII